MILKGRNLKKDFFCLVFILALSNIILIQPGISADTVSTDTMKFTLADCLEMALDHQPQLVAAREAVNVAKAQLRETESAYLPQLNVGNSVSRSNVENSGTGNAYDNEAVLSQLIYDFGRTPATIRESSENIKIQELNYLATELTVRLNVKTAYYTLLENKEGVRIAKETLTNTNLQLKLANVAYTIGTASRLDVATAEAQVANAELSLVQAKNNYDVAVRTLNTAMGLDSNTYQNVDLAESPYTTVTTDLNSLINVAMKNRPDILTYVNQKEQLKSALVAAERGHLPSLSASGEYNQTGGSGSSQVDSWSGGLSLSMSLFDGFNTEGKIQEEKADLRNLAAEEENSRQAAQLDVTTNYLNTKSGEEQIKSARKVVDAGKEALNLATGRYKNGLGSILDLTNAQTTYTSAEVSLAQAIYSYQINYAKLQKSLGEK